MKNTHALSGVAAAIALALSFGVVSAQEIVQTETVHVTASRVEQELMDVPMSVSVMTSEDIERESGKTIADYLDSIPGVEVQNDGSQGLKRIQIRGESTFRTLVMIDGQKVSEHKSMSGTPILVDPSQIERIEVIKGPASVLYGSDAIGGAVNIITKKGGRKPFEGYVTGGLDTSASGKTLAGGIAGHVNGWSYRINGSVEDFGELDTPVGKVENTEFTSRSGSLFLAYDINENIQVGGSFDTFDLESKSANQIGVLEGSMRDFYVDIPEWKRSKGALFVDMKNLTDNLVRLRMDTFYQKTTKEMENLVQPAAMPLSMQNWADNDLRQTGFSVQSDWQLGEHYLVAGYEYSHDDLDAKSRFTMGRGSMDTRESYDAKQETHSVYASAESPVTDEFTLNYGVRYTWVSGEASMKGQEVGSRPGAPYGEKNDASDGHAVFNLGAVWRVLDDVALRASWAQGYRYPTMQELYITTQMGGGIAYANPDLKPETSDNFEVGVRWESERVSLDAAVFYNMADDYITDVSIGNRPGYMSVTRFMNVGEATTYGLETTLSYALPYDLEPYVNLTLMRRKFEQNGISTYDSGTPEITSRLGVKWTPEWNGLHIRTDAYADVMSASDSSNLDPTDEEITHIGGATTFNLTGGVSFGKDDSYALDAGFYNIFDKKYTKSGSLYEPGRYFAVKFNAKF